MQPATRQFKQRSVEALKDETLQAALGRIQAGFIDKRKAAIGKLPEFEQLRAEGKGIKDHTLAHLDFYLEQYESRVKAQGGDVHWASTAADARQKVVEICRRARVQRVAKAKSMVSEEVAINGALEAEGMEVVETDLGEYILQLAKESPSHIIAPAIHKTRQQISDLFRTHHAHVEVPNKPTGISDLVNEARLVLRDRFLKADVGITGANFLVAETGTSVMVTNEGNGDLCCSLPRVHIVIAGIEKVVPTLDDATTLLRLLGRSATGQEITTYTTFSTGPRKMQDEDGPEEYHVVLVDNGRTAMLGTEFQEMLRCIRCGACMNHCPVYGAVGGHAYGWVYPGPMGSVLTPLMVGLEEAGDLPNACTLNGRCQQVCPMDISLPRMLRALRQHRYEARRGSKVERWGLSVWAWLVRRPRLYQVTTNLVMKVIGRMGWRRGRFSYLPLAGAWTQSRDFPAPQGKTFQAVWRKRSNRERRTNG